MEERKVSVYEKELPKEVGVCCKKITITVEENQLGQKIIASAEFKGGCNGNLKAISKLIVGETPERISEILEGITCMKKPTSCADQFSKMLKEVIDGSINPM